MHDDDIPIAFDAYIARIQTGRHFRPDDPLRLIAHRRVAQPGNAATTAEQAHAHAKTMQRLAQLDPDHAGPEHRHRAGQVLPVEHVIIDDQAVAGSAQRFRNVGTRAGGEDDRARTYALELGQRAIAGRAQSQGMRVFERSMCAHHMLRIETSDCVLHEANEAVALLPHALHHRTAIDLACVALDAEVGQGGQAMACVSRCDQQFRRHAAHAGTGRAERATFDQGDAVGAFADLAIRGHAGSAGTNDRDFDLMRVHGQASPRCGNVHPGRR